MTSLFRRLQPAKKFRVNVLGLARLLRISRHLIVRVECWAYMVFVHRRDRGGQFISYRQLEQWTSAIASQFQQCCSNLQQQKSLWLSLVQDYKKFTKHYGDSVMPFLRQIWMQSKDLIQKQEESAKLISAEALTTN